MNRPADATTVLAHEWLEPTGGSENVFAAMVEALPTARVECLWNNAPERFPTAHESHLASSWVRDRKAASLAFMRSAWNRVDLDGVDRVVASSHAMAHHFAGRAARLGIPAYAYVHSPARYVWDPDLDVRGKSLAGSLGRPVLKRMDLEGVDPRVHYAVNSRFVADRVRRAWGMDATVIHPVVDTERLQSETDWSARLEPAEREVVDALPQEFVLGASRLVEYKRLDAAITVGEAVGMPVVIAGFGPFEAELRRRAAVASVPVHFLGRVSDAGLFTLYQRTRLYVFMAVEDFGIMPVEAMALGAPCLLRDLGGARETAERLGFGVLADPDQPSRLASAAREALVSGVDRDEVRAAFSRTTFEKEFLTWVGA